MGLCKENPAGVRIYLQHTDHMLVTSAAQIWLFYIGKMYDSSNNNNHFTAIIHINLR